MNITTRACIALLILVLFSFFKSCQEVQYGIWGKKTTATVTTVVRNRGKYGRELSTFSATYAAPSDTDEPVIGQYVIDEDEVANNPPGMQVPIVYVHSNGMTYSRHAHDRHLIWIIISVLALTGLVVAGWLAWQQAGVDVANSKRR